jgi:hypothetical protein
MILVRSSPSWRFIQNLVASNPARTPSVDEELACVKSGAMRHRLQRRFIDAYGMDIAEGTVRLNF